MTRRPVGPADAIWLNMDRPNNLMVIDSLMWCDERVDWERLRAVIARRLVTRFPVFAQRPVSAGLVGGRQFWEDDPDFDLDRHLRRVTLPAPGDQAALQRFVDSQLGRPLDRAHPLWELHLVDGFGGGSAILTRFHHSLADGIALAEVLLSLTDAAPDDDLVAKAGSEGARTPGVARGGIAVPGLGLVWSTARQMASLGRSVRPTLLTDAVRLTEETAHIANKLLLGSNPATPLAGVPGIDKHAVWSHGTPLSDIKTVARLAEATVNDVLMSAVSAAISEYLAERGADPADLTTMVPVNLRPTDQPLPAELGNRFALVLLTLPTSSHAPLARLAETKRRMDRIKASPEAAITFGLIRGIGLTHPRLERLLVDFFSGKAIGVTTNVVGPARERYVAGSRIKGSLGWVPGSGRQTLGVSIFTYDGTVTVGFKTDAGVVPEPQRLVDAFERELASLLHIAQAA